DPYVFRIDLSEHGMGTAKVVFGREAGAGTTAHLEMPPLTLVKRPASKGPRLWITGALAGAATAMAVGRRRKARPSDGRPAERSAGNREAGDHKVRR
ncbi:MAG TPA: hypothetical protein VFA46_06385, partial [Actinomycetes bacterium]|nr:hypothetical protein [Actinomycetes bacterium]